MQNYLIKFKNDLRKEQTNRKTILKHFESKLSLLEKIITTEPELITELTLDDIEKKLFINSIIFSTEQAQENLIILMNKKRTNKKKKEIELKKIKNYYDFLLNFVENVKKQYLITQNIINAFENDKIKEPINNMQELYQELNNTSLSIDEINKIIGISISFNNQYAKRNKNHNINNIDIISSLSQYYNQDGTFKYNEDTLTYKLLLEKLLIANTNKNEFLINHHNKTITFKITDLVKLLETNNEKLRNSTSPIEKSEKLEQNKNYTISPETRKALQEVRKYYKNGTIIQIPENLEEFNKVLEDCNLDEREKIYILNLINEKILNERNMSILKHLTKNQQDIYEKAINLLNSFNYSNSDTKSLKQNIKQLQIINQTLETNIDEKEKETLLKEISNITEQLLLICTKYSIKNTQSSNRFIFLHNKDGIPYIYDDIDSLDSSYRKAIYSLISKINKSNQSYFQKILNNEKLIYNMYEVRSPRAHVAFVEIDTGIYIIIGANIPRNGYKELLNRLKANQSTLLIIENTVKNPQTRNQILKLNEQYLTIIYESINIETSKQNKLTLKQHNK